jgi:glutamate dehydrogenase
MSNNTDRMSSLSLSQLHCQIDDFSAEILDIVKAETRGELYKKFVKQFLRYVPIDYRSSDKLNSFGDFTYEAFEFCKKRHLGERKVELHVTKFRNDPSISILVCTENRPFIIDSINSLLSKLALHTIFTFHPVISVVRDRDGNLKDVVENGESHVDESLVYIKILGTFEDSVLESIQSEVHKIIDLVNYTYDSWQTLLNKIIGITTDIVHNKELYEQAHLPAEETLDFLNWLQKNNITFLGVVEFDVATKKLTHEDGVRDIWNDNLQEISTIIEFSKSEYYKNKLAMLGKIDKLSPVHRNALVDYILVKRLDEDGEYRSGTIIFGLYGTAIYFQSIKSVPILRGKMNYVLDESGFPINGYNAKKIKNIIESLPRDVLIQIDEQDLYCMCIHMLSSMRSHKLKLFIQKDWSNSFINVIIFLPRQRLTPEVYNKISRYLTNKFGTEIIADNITVVAQDFAHLFATIGINDVSKLDFSHEEMRQDLVKITTDWSEALLQKLNEELGEYEGGIRHKALESSFSAEYRHKFNADITLDDIHHLEKASKSNKLVFNLTESGDDEFTLKLYSPRVKLTLSEMLPDIENLGFIAIDEQSFAIKKSTNFKKSWIYEFQLRSPISIGVSFAELKYNIEEALVKVKEQTATSDMLNKLLVLSGFDWREVKLVRALTRYLHQTGFLYGKEYVQQTLVKHSKFAEMLVDLFAAKFDPKTASKERAKSILENMHKYLHDVSSSTEDKVLQNIMLIIEAMVRTNFYQKNSNSGIKYYLSFKFDSSKVPDLPLPIPFAEIFVYSSSFEGIHLRGGKVARGGLRWSDRGEDYRTEVLGLMKAQMTKNTLIVPVGSKGSFYMNFAQGEMSQEDYMQKVIACYQNFLRGLLDVTDNLVKGKIVHPKDVVMHDDPDHYLVVAADKGTASFSDYANEISKEYGFWLGDAFASGGSAGYDHKKMGITAKGAWISAQSHFMDMGIDIQKEPFTVAGIGDMSGDVFGNGMLLSRCIKLVAAFNHQHIFIDPTPDCEISYEERKRLFYTPRSKWTDYNRELISNGGGVFDRGAKILQISKEIRHLLDLDSDTITPDRLIRSILKAKVDLLWNGGIGTYIKASSENNIDIGDKANDVLRVNGNEVLAKVVAEGGNLGVSQLGRIEYALNGGRINTDFIDNSAGVDCSDHEVNIKIALNNALLAKKISLEERNDILGRMTKDVEELVLFDNHDQNLALTVTSLSKSFSLDSFGQLIKELEKSGLLNREVEFLPSKTELARRAMAHESMTKPELAILLSYSKMELDIDSASCDFADDKYFEKYLLGYFPKVMQEKFKEEIKSHPLRREIIRTVAVNKLANELGGVSVHSIKRETGSSAGDLIKAHAIVAEVLGLDQIWKDIENLGTSVDISIKVEMFSAVGRIIRRGINWFIKNSKLSMGVEKIIEEFHAPTEELAATINKLLVGITKARFIDRVEHYTVAGINKKLAKSIATLEVLVSAFDVIFIAKKTKTDNKEVANLYFESGDVFSIDWLRRACEAEPNETYWNRLSLQSLKDDFYDKQRRLIIAIISNNKGSMNLKSWLQENSAAASIFMNFVEDIKLQEVNLNMIILANRKLEIFLRKLKAEKWLQN